jgi:Integrase/Phage integrase, N-terminal
VQGGAVSALSATSVAHAARAVLAARGAALARSLKMPRCGSSADTDAAFSPYKEWRLAMSRKGKLTHEACDARRGPRGAFESRKNSRHIWEPFFRFLDELDMLPRRVRDVPIAAIMLYLHHCLSRGLAVGTVRNIATEIRVVMKRCGRDIDHFTNKHFGLATRHREGKKRPPTQKEIREVHGRARRADHGVYLLVRIQELFGLRRVEAVRSAPDYDRWARLLAGGANAVPVRRGPKGGRPRRTHIIEHRREETVALLREAARYCRAHGGRLLRGRRNNLEGSLNRLKALYRTIGLKGEISGHSLRYLYAHVKAIEYLDKGIPEYEVLLMISCDLGHGPSRCGFTLRTYLRGLAHRFTKIMRNGKLIRMPKHLMDDKRFQRPARQKPDGARAFWRARIKNRRAGEGEAGARQPDSAPHNVRPATGTSTRGHRARTS